MQSESYNHQTRLCITQFRRFLDSHNVMAVMIGDMVYSSWYFIVNPNVIQFRGADAPLTLRMVQAVIVDSAEMTADILYLSLETAEQQTLHISMSAA